MEDKHRNYCAYRDSLPNADDYSAVHAREPALWHVNSHSTRTAPAERSTQQSTAAWRDTVSWAPGDNTEFALDQDGDLYDEEVGRSVMDEQPPGPSPQPAAKKKKARSKVSRRPHVVWKEASRRTHLEEENAAGRDAATSFTQPSALTVKLGELLPAAGLSVNASSASCRTSYAHRAACADIAPILFIGFKDGMG